MTMQHVFFLSFLFCKIQTDIFFVNIRLEKTTRLANLFLASDQSLVPLCEFAVTGQYHSQVAKPVRQLSFVSREKLYVVYSHHRRHQLRSHVEQERLRQQFAILIHLTRGCQIAHVEPSFGSPRAIITPSIRLF